MGGAAGRGSILTRLCVSGFNAARGFVGGAAVLNAHIIEMQGRFNAARGFVGGAASI